MDVYKNILSIKRSKTRKNLTDI